MDIPRRSAHTDIYSVEASTAEALIRASDLQDEVWHLWLRTEEGEGACTAQPLLDAQTKMLRILAR
eukprot:8021784-Pyramimonas_sp.AAC.1